MASSVGNRPSVRPSGVRARAFFRLWRRHSSRKAQSGHKTTIGGAGTTCPHIANACRERYLILCTHVDVTSMDGHVINGDPEGETATKKVQEAAASSSTALGTLHRRRRRRRRRRCCGKVLRRRTNRPTTPTRAAAWLPSPPTPGHPSSSSKSGINAMG